MRTHTGKYIGRSSHLRPTGISEVRARLTALQLNPRYAPFVRREIDEANDAILLAERTDPDAIEAHELVDSARIKVDRTIETARLRYISALGGGRRPNGSH